MYFLLQEPIELHFMKQGSHLGALGALINNLEHFIGKDGNVPDDSKSESTSESKTES